MANTGFHDQFVGAHAIFKPYRISDHSPSVLCLPTLCKEKPKPFKFFNVLTKHERFKELLYEKGNLHANVSSLRSKLDSIQSLLDADPFNANLKEAEASCVVEFNQAALMEEPYFHKTVKSRDSRNRIDTITNAEGLVFVNEAVPNIFVSHCEMFLGLAGETQGFNDSNLFKTCLNEQVATNMVRNVTPLEVKEALFSMGDDKSPGPDGYTACFFKAAWEVVADDVTNAICEFFRNGNLLKELNHTIIALIPKVKSPTRVNDYRSISCCNVLFKCISKIIANRIKHNLKFLISPNQSVFIPSRSITDNILLTQELMHNYHLDRGTPRCAFKVDIQKAYDTVDWEFLRRILHGFGFHARMIAWIMECVTNTSYFICVNGSLHGYFRGKRGLHQGDPLSPYLFTLVMEVLTLMLQRRVHESQVFTYHRFCSKLELVNLCFADDLFLFAYGDVHSASMIKEALEEFKGASGLTPSLPKSTAYFCNVLNHVKLSILQILPFEEGKLPVKYLGVPLVSSRLLIRDSMHIYWASVFILPSCVLLNIEQLVRGFLWSPSSLKKGRSKVAWERGVCLVLKMRRGLGIRRLGGGLSHTSRSDCLVWRNSQGVSKPFSVAQDFDQLGCVGIPRVLYVLFGGIQRLSCPNIYAHYRDSLIPIASRRSILSLIAKLVVAASAYYIWQERNWRLFKNCKRKPIQILAFKGKNLQSPNLMLEPLRHKLLQRNCLRTRKCKNDRLEFYVEQRLNHLQQQLFNTILFYHCSIKSLSYYNHFKMSTLAEFMIVFGADNRPLMLDKPQYESWKSHMEHYIQGKDHGRIILNSVENGPLVWPTVEQEDGTVTLKTYKELSNN
ncbi:hypothetical protein Tco_1363192 [Tanacetum coccineum]